MLIKVKDVNVAHDMDSLNIILNKYTVKYVGCSGWLKMLFHFTEIITIQGQLKIV